MGTWDRLQFKCYPKLDKEKKMDGWENNSALTGLVQTTSQHFTHLSAV